MKKVDVRLERDGAAALFEGTASTTMRTWEESFAAMAANGGVVTACFVKHQGRSVLAQARRARATFVEHRPLGLPAGAVLAHPGDADVSLDSEGPLTALYGDPASHIETGRSGIRFKPSMCTADDVTSAFLALKDPGRRACCIRQRSKVGAHG